MNENKMLQYTIEISIQFQGSWKYSRPSSITYFSSKKLNTSIKTTEIGKSVNIIILSKSLSDRIFGVSSVVKLIMN